MAKRIRPIALGLIEHEDHIFVSQGEDPATQETYYRFLGGGIEFGETSSAALVREFEEEISAKLIEVSYITCLDNVFEYGGKQKHELIQLFSAKFADASFYALGDRFRLVEGELIKDAFWLEKSRVLSGECKLVPESCLQFL